VRWRPLSQRRPTVVRSTQAGFSRPRRTGRHTSAHTQKKQSLASSSCHTPRTKPLWNSVPTPACSSSGWPLKAPSLLLRRPQDNGVGQRQARATEMPARRQGTNWCMTHYAHQAPALGQDGALAMLAYWRYTVDGVNRRLSLFACISAARQSQAPTPPFVYKGTPLF